MIQPYHPKRFGKWRRIIVIFNLLNEWERQKAKKKNYSVCEHTRNFTHKKMLAKEHWVYVRQSHRVKRTTFVHDAIFSFLLHECGHIFAFTLTKALFFDSFLFFRFFLVDYFSKTVRFLYDHAIRYSDRLHFRPFWAAIFVHSCLRFLKRKKNTCPFNSIQMAKWEITYLRPHRACNKNARQLFCECIRSWVFLFIYLYVLAASW